LCGLSLGEVALPIKGNLRDEPWWCGLNEPHTAQREPRRKIAGELVIYSAADHFLIPS